MSLKKLLAAIACVFIFGFATYLSYLLVVDELVFFQRGVSTQAVVLHKQQERSQRAGKSGSSSSWHVVYEFEVGGRKLKNKNMLDVGRGYDAIEKGDVIDVVYDPQNLDVNRAHLAAPFVRYPLSILFIYAMGGMIACVPIRILLRKEYKTGYMAADRYGAHFFS